MSQILQQKDYERNHLKHKLHVQLSVECEHKTYLTFEFTTTTTTTVVEEKKAKEKAGVASVVFPNGLACIRKHN
ncbi:hypothetical protein T06_3871 [Trichinella sp. T6]|nr:hypothetical protein T06_3871 [Trichinella sp. T6]